LCPHLCPPYESERLPVDSGGRFNGISIIRKL